MNKSFDQSLYDLNDEKLALLIQNGKSDVFEILINRYEDKISRYLRKFLSNKEDIEDILQDIFIKCFVNIQSFDTQQRFSPWIYRIAHNEAVNLLKKNYIRPFSFDIFDETLPFVHPKAKEESVSKAENEIIKRYLDNIFDKLDSKYREIIILYFYEDMSYKDISDVLKIPISLVGVRIQRAKIIIKKILSEENIQIN